MNRTLYALLLPALIAMTAVAGAATVDVELTGVANDQGLIRVAVCTAETFTTKHCPFFGATPAQPGSVVVQIDNIPAGRYALQAYHDEDGNGRVRRGLFGIASEAIGFSRDAPLRFGPPYFEDAAVSITEPSTTVRIRLRHVGP